MGDDLSGLLAALGGDSLQALGALALDADEDRELRIGIALAYLDLVGTARLSSASKSPG